MFRHSSIILRYILDQFPLKEVRLVYIVMGLKLQIYVFSPPPGLFAWVSESKLYSYTVLY